MNELILPVTPGSLSSGVCYATEQERLDDFSAHQTVVFPTTFAGITVSSTHPSDTTQAWLRLDSLGRPTQLYYFAQGAWLSMHPLVPGATIRWTSALPNFTTFDGGDANALSSISGPMWEQVTDANGKFVLGVGTLPSGTVVNVGDTGGEEKHTITVNELPAHSHFVSNIDGSLSALTPANYLAQRNLPDSSQSFDYNLYGTATTPTIGNSSNTGAGQPENNMPPYIGYYLLRRTNRLFYTVT